jgi:hypothetical protein
MGFTSSRIFNQLPGAFREEEVCSRNFLRDIAAACRKISPLVEFTTRALGLKYQREESGSLSRISLASRTDLLSRSSASFLFASRARSLKALTLLCTSTNGLVYSRSSTMFHPLLGFYSLAPHFQPDDQPDLHVFAGS